VLRVPGLSFERIAKDSKIGMRLPRVEAVVTSLEPVRAETEQQEQSVKRARGTRALYILASAGRALMLRLRHRAGHAPNMLPKPTRLQYPDCVFRPLRALLSNELTVFWLVGTPLKRRRSGSACGSARRGARLTARVSARAFRPREPERMC